LNSRYIYLDKWNDDREKITFRIYRDSNIVYNLDIMYFVAEKELIKYHFFVYTTGI
jgi:hypothetical protein